MRWRRYHGPAAWSRLCFCDLDGFKAVNDSLGHQAGDELLVVAAKRLASIVRGGDTVARLGGDEFAVLFDNISTPDIATALAERMVSVLREPAAAAGQQNSLTVSVGVAFADMGNNNRTAAERSRHRDVRSEGARQRPVHRLRIADAFTNHRSHSDDQRLPNLAGTRRILPRIPAADLPRRWRPRRIRSISPLAPPHAGSSRSLPLHPTRRGHRIRRRARSLDPGDRVPRSSSVGSPWRRTAGAIGKPLSAPARGPSSRQRRRGRARATPGWTRGNSSWKSPRAC